MVKEKEEKIILALDISTSCIGISVFDSKATLLYLKYIKLKTDKDVLVEHRFLAKANVFSEYIKDIKENQDFKITDVVIEEPLPNSKNRNTVNVLMKFNGVCSYIVMNQLNILPSFISVRDVRCLVCPELVKKKKIKNEVKNILSFPKDIDKKVYIFDKINHWYKDINWVYNRNDKLSDVNFDMSDSSALGIAYLLQNNYIKYSDLKNIS